MNIEQIRQGATTFVNNYLAKISADTLGWLAVILFNCVLIPTMLAIMTGLSDRTPNLDIVGFLWAGLAMLFFRAIVLRDMLNIITIGVGFMVQAVLMALILFK
jgi:hypothetical protein